MRMDPPHPTTAAVGEAPGSLTREASAASLYVSAPPSPRSAYGSPEGGSSHETTTITGQFQYESADGKDSSPKVMLTRLLKGKEREWAAVAEKGPKRLLDLPVDILREIINQVSGLFWLKRCDG